MTDDTAHERNGKENDDVGEGDGQGGETNFRSSVDGGFAGIFTEFEVTVDVLKNDDRVINQHANRERQGQHRHVIDREAEQLEGDKCGED